jgi:hypothetical protein
VNHMTQRNLPVSVLSEKLYTIKELCRVTNINERRMRLLFQNVPGVLCTNGPEAARGVDARGHRTRQYLRIPESIALQVLQRVGPMSGTTGVVV